MAHGNWSRSQHILFSISGCCHVRSQNATNGPTWEDDFWDDPPAFSLGLIEIAKHYHQQNLAFFGWFPVTDMVILHIDLPDNGVPQKSIGDHHFSLGT